MGLLNFLFGNTTSTTIDSLGKAIDAAFTSEEEKLQAQAVLEKLRQQPSLMQAETNKIAAHHASWFVAGDRPALLWVAAIGWLMEFVMNPIFQMFAGEKFDMPVDQMVWLTGAVLGIYGTLRTVEKINGKSS